MIVDPQDNTMAMEIPSESPPSYDLATDSSSSSGGDASQSIPKPTHTPDIKHPVPESGSVQLYGGVIQPQHTIQPGYTRSPMVHHYTNPTTGQRVVSLLPPDHPEMICLQAGVHVPETKYGLLGILAAVFWFPLGIGLCLLDRRVKCIRCGAVLNDGICH